MHLKQTDQKSKIQLDFRGSKETEKAIANLQSGNAFPVDFAIIILYDADLVRVLKFKNTAISLSVVYLYLKCICVWVNIITLTHFWRMWREKDK